MWLAEVEGSTTLSILCAFAVPKHHKLFPLNEIGKTFRRWILKVDAFIIFYCLTICKDNNKIRIVKILSVLCKDSPFEDKSKRFGKKENFVYIMC